jgi:hypothetical protein
MRAAAGFHSNDARRQFGKELQNGIPSESFAQNNLILRIDAMNLKDVFGQIEA